MMMNTPTLPNMLNKHTLVFPKDFATTILNSLFTPSASLDGPSPPQL